MKPGTTYMLGKDISTGKAIYITMHEGPQCGIECSCCEFGDGTAPCDHDRDCPIFKDGFCDCEADQKALERKRDENG